MPKLSKKQQEMLDEQRKNEKEIRDRLRKVSNCHHFSVLRCRYRLL